MQICISTCPLHGSIHVPVNTSPMCFFIQIDCNESLGLYRFVKESHGQDGQTCYGQLKMIQNCGRYIIRIPSKNSSADIIRVYIDPRKKFMTVDELMDLESKLILIQRKADNSAELEQFFDVSYSKIPHILHFIVISLAIVHILNVTVHDICVCSEWHSCFLIRACL